MLINLQTVEELIFYDQKVRKLLAEFQPLFNQWTFARQFGGLEHLVKKSVLDVLNSLTEEHAEILSQHFNSKVTIDKLEYAVVRNLELPIDKAEEGLESIEGFENFTASMDSERLYISFWR
jgi:hypothetical protein